MKTLTKEEFREKLLKDIRRRKEREKMIQRIIVGYVSDAKFKNWKRALHYHRRLD